MSNETIVKGKIHKIMDTVVFESGFQKREFVIETLSEYPQMIKFDILKDKVNILDSYKEGDLVESYYNINGNEYQGKYYVNLTCWRLNKEEGQTAPATESKVQVVADDDDIPF